MSHRKLVTIGVAIAALIIPAAAQANPANSIQPAHVYFGQVESGDHPNRLVTLHNGTGSSQTIAGIAISGSGGYVFTLPTNNPALWAAWTQHDLARCRNGMTLQPGARCVLDVRVHTIRAGWWRSVLRVTYGNGWFNSSELRAHVVAP